MYKYRTTYLSFTEMGDIGTELMCQNLNIQFDYFLQGAETCYKGTTSTYLR